MPPDGICDGDTITCGASGLAPMPNRFAIVAVLSIGVPGEVPPGITTSNTIVAVPFAGTLMPDTSSCVGVELSVAPGGMPTTASEVVLAGSGSVTDTAGAATAAVSRSVIV